LWVSTFTDLVGFASPAVGGGLVYFSNNPPQPNSGGIEAFDAAGTTNCSAGPPTKTCASIWGAVVGDSVASSPAFAVGVVYVGADHDGAAGGALLAFDAAGRTNCSGTPNICQPLWKAALGGAGFSDRVSSPAVAGGAVYIGSKDGKLYAFDAAGSTNCSGSPKTCQPLWTATTGAGIQASPAVANGVVYVGSFDHKLYA
jgi:outer membrane protein assembly factor BamB